MKFKLALAFAVLLAFELAPLPALAGGPDLRPALHALADNLVALQNGDGHWDGVFEGDPSTDALVLVLGNRLGLLDSKLAQEGVRRIFSHPDFAGGLWANYPGGAADLSITATCLAGLRAAGVADTDPRIQAARRWLESQGGWKAVHPMFATLLGAAGAVPASELPYVTPKFFAFSQKMPVNVFDIGMARTAFIPLAIWSYYRSAIDSAQSVGVLDPARLDSAGKQFGNYWGGWLGESAILPGTGSGSLFDWTDLGYAMRLADSLVPGTRDYWAQEGVGWLLAEAQKDGTWAGVLQSTYMSLLALNEAQEAGAGDLSAAVLRGWNGILSWRRLDAQGNGFQQFSQGPVMETARVLLALGPANQGLWSLEQERRAIDWLVGKQILKPGDWAYRLPGATPGGWAYEDFNDFYPDVDDSAMAVQALAQSSFAAEPGVRMAIDRGVNWVLAMQNDDGGFPAWEHETPKWMQKVFSASLGMDVLIDPSEVDVTSRAIRALVQAKEPGRSGGGVASAIDAAVAKGCRFIESNAQQGKWRGDWAVDYLYGTAESVSALLDAGCWSTADAAPQIEWLIRQQNEVDGGWGESPESYPSDDFVPAPSAPSQTAFVLNGLLTYVMRLPTGSATDSAPVESRLAVQSAVDRGLKYLEGQARGGQIREKGYLQVLFKGWLYGRYDLLPQYESLKAFRNAARAAAPQ